MAQLTLDLPGSLVEHAKYFCRATHRDAETVLADTLEMMWPAWEDLPARAPGLPVESLSDAEILEMADLKDTPDWDPRGQRLSSCCPFLTGSEHCPWRLSANEFRRWRSGVSSPQFIGSLIKSVKSFFRQTMDDPAFSR